MIWSALPCIHSASHHSSVQFIIKQHNVICRVFQWVAKWFSYSAFSLWGLPSKHSMLSLLSVLSSIFFLMFTWCSEKGTPRRAVRIPNSPPGSLTEAPLCLSWGTGTVGAPPRAPALRGLAPAHRYRRKSLYFFFLSGNFPSSVSAGNHPPSCTRTGRKWPGREPQTLRKTLNLPHALVALLVPLSSGVQGLQQGQSPALPPERETSGWWCSCSHLYFQHWCEEAFQRSSLLSEPFIYRKTLRFSLRRSSQGAPGEWFLQRPYVAMCPQRGCFLNHLIFAANFTAPILLTVHALSSDDICLLWPLWSALFLNSSITLDL